MKIIKIKSKKYILMKNKKMISKILKLVMEKRQQEMY